MKYLLLLSTTLIFMSCARQPLNIYSPQPANTVIVKDNGDAGLNVVYFANGPKHAAENNLYSNGIAAQGRVVFYNKCFLESSLSFLNEVSDGEFYVSANSPNKIFKSNAKYYNKEIGFGKIIKLNKSGCSRFLLSGGYGYTKHTNNYEIIGNNVKEIADFNFNNNHLYINTGFQFCTGSFTYQVGLKNNFVNFKNITTNNQPYFGEDITELNRNISNYKASIQLYQDFGIFPIKNNEWFSIHVGISNSTRIDILSKFKTRTFGGYLSIMVNPSKLLKWKK